MNYNTEERTMRCAPVEFPVPAPRSWNEFMKMAHQRPLPATILDELAACDLDDEQLERGLREALRDGDQKRLETLRAEARRRFAGMLGLPAELMGDA